MFEPFGQLIALLPPAHPAATDAAPVAPSLLYRLAILAFWSIVATIVIARTVLASHGGLFAFGS